MTVDRIPHDVETLVRDAAQAPLGYGGDFADIPRIARRQRNRQTAAVFAGVAAVLAVVGAGVAVQRGPDRAPVNPPAATTNAPTPAGAQRLMLNGADGSYRTFENGTQKYTTLGNEQVGEFTVDGSWQWRLHQVVGADRWDQFIGRPDGSTVALGPKGPATFLVVAGPGGSVELSRDVAKPGEKVALVGATEEYAYLWRPAGLVEHTLNAGGERVLITNEQLEITGFDDGQLLAADLENEHLVIVRKAQPCAVEVFDLAKPAEADIFSMDEGHHTCLKITAVRVSPDASRIAMVRWDRDPDSAPQLETIATDGNSPLVGTSIDLDPTRSEEPIFAMSWVDKDTVRGVAYRAVDGRSDLTPFTAVS
jgi:hypothetical protein